MNRYSALFCSSKKIQKNLVFLFFFLPAINVLAQFNFQRDHSIPVFNGNENLKNAWAGGINSAQISSIDLNGDGLEDFFVFDKSSRKILTFLNNGEAENNYQYTDEYNHLFPPVQYWVLLRDFNCDGKKDIFSYSTNGGGIMVYENTTPSGGELNFSLYTSLVNSYYNLGGGFVNSLYVSSQDIPAIFDYDGDGDLDVLTFTLAGSSLELHVNNSIETTGTCDTLAFALGSRCYGSAAEGTEDNTITLGANCSFDVPNPRSNGNRHVGSTILTMDINQNGKQDILLGDVSYRNMVLLKTEVSEFSGRDTIVEFEVDFPASWGGAPPVDVEIFPAGFYEDVNNDGIKDLLVSPNNEYTSINQRSIWLYKNEGENDSPEFSLIREDFLQHSMIEVGESSHPHLFDIDQDGLLDLLVSNRQAVISENNTQTRIAYYRNTGTTTSPSFQLITPDFLSLSSMDLGQALRPAFTDLDGDGDFDMILGRTDGLISVFNNVAGPGNPLELVPSSSPYLTDNNGINIDPGQNSVPVFVDLNRDGLMDLVIGERNGNLNYYENTGTQANPEFTLITESLGNVLIYLDFITSGYAAPQFVDYAGEYYLILGGEPGRFHLYNNIDDNLTGEFNLLDENAFGGIFNGLRNTAAIADLNQDGWLDLISGNLSGGLVYYAGADTVLSTINLERKSDLIAIPNPVGEYFSIGGLPDNYPFFKISIYDVQGRLVNSTEITGEEKITTEGLVPGFYVVNVSAGTFSGYLKIIKQ